MPIQNGKYVAPTWVNGAAPAIDATELQAISDSIVNNEEAITAIGTPVQIETGSYVGTGKDGSSNPNTLTFSFTPAFITILPSVESAPRSGTSGNYGTYGGWLIPPRNAGYVRGSSTGSSVLTVTSSGNTVSWYDAGGSDPQMNQPITYYYYAIGE